MSLMQQHPPHGDLHCDACGCLCQVTSTLRLSDLRLHNRHLPNLRVFTAVRELNLANNKLSSVVDLGLEHMHDLQLLDVQHNTITWVPPPLPSP
jgi:hypothetical protein